MNIMSNNMSNNNHTRHYRAPSGAPSVPDLLSFESWDYDSTMVSATSSFSDSASLQTSPSISSDPTKFCNHSIHTSNANNANNANHDPYHSADDIHIQVSGASFTLNPAVFRQLEKLPWSVVRTNNVNGNNVTVTTSYSLGTSPDLFEILLNYVLFESLPDIKLLSSSDMEELEPMVLILSLTGLHAHLINKRDWDYTLKMKKTLLSSRSSFRRMNSSSKMNTDQNPRQERNNNGATSNNNNKLLRRQVSAPVVGGASTAHEAVKAKTGKTNTSNIHKGVASRLMQVVARRRPSNSQQQQQGRNLTHAQWVASDLVD
jgi:hypothetical protein